MIQNSKTLSHGVKAEDTKLKRDVAIKFLPANMLQGEAEKEALTSQDRTNLNVVFNWFERDGFAHKAQNGEFCWTKTPGQSTK